LPEALQSFITTGAVRQFGLITVRNPPTPRAAQPGSMKSETSPKTKMSFITQLPKKCLAVTIGR
jgi:hypothetical protein